jgi:hypothetical protein
MDIVGMYIGIWVARDEIEQIFGLDPVSSARVFLLGGEVLGEAPAGMGLWVRLDTVSIAGGPHDLFPDLAKEKPRRLIRWEYIRAAEMFDTKFDMERVVGFRPHAA